MKKLFNSLFVVIAATATFAGCQKEENNAPATQTKTVEFFAESIETKTHFGDKNAENKYPTLWDEGDKVKVLMNLERVNDVSGLEKTSEAMKVGDISNDGASARFQVELNADYQMPSYTYYAIVPSSAYNNKDADARKITIIIPKSQTPQSNVLDKTAQVIYAVSETYTTRQNTIALNFKHFTAYGKFSLLNLTDKISTVQSVSIEFEGVNNLAGKWDYNVESDTKEVNMGESQITLTTASETDIWFACAPVDVSGKKLTVTVTDVNGKQLVKEVTMPLNCVFESGKISTFSVNMSGIEPPVQEETAKCFQKVTSVPSDWSGTYLIVYETGKVAFDGNLSSLDVASNTISVNIENNTIAYTDVLMRSTFEVAKNGDNYSLKSASGKYIGSTTYDNDIDESTDTKYPNTFSLSNGNVQIGATNTNSGQSIMKYNDTSGQNRFRYYKSGQKDIQLYRLVEGQSGGETPDQPDTPASPVQLIMTDITCSAQTENSLTFTWASVANASKYEVSINGRTEKVDGITYTATGLNAATQYTISVKAVGDGTNYTTSEAKTQIGTTTAAQGGGEEGSKTGYTLVETLSDIETGEYVIAVNVNGTYYAMKNAFASKITGGAITVTDKTIAESDAADYVVTITKSGNNFTIKNDSSYLKYSSSTNLGTQTTAYDWTISSGTKGSFRVLSGTSGRGLVFRASTYNQFGGYAISNISANGTEYYDVELFKKN